MIHILDLFGVAVFAVTGTLAAGRKRMDVFGIIMVALVTALGGGTIRDVVLGKVPVFWIVGPVYLIVAIAAGLLTFVLARFVRTPASILLPADALGLAVFTVIGAQKAMDANVSGLVVVIMGVMTGVAGGILRDLLCGEIPLILRREVYATASLAGGLLFLLLSELQVNSNVAALSAIVTVLLVRLAAIRWRLSLPVFRDVDATGKR